jgi:DNA-binding CsgD family transcriptional regulator
MSTFYDNTRVLFDRDRPLRELESLIDEARARSEPASVRVIGPPGIGKTAFLRHFIGKAGATKTLFVSAEPGDDAKPGGCVRDLVANLAPPDADEKRLRWELCAAADASTMFVVDDLQWLDEMSLRIIAAAAHECPERFTLVAADRRAAAPDLLPHRSMHLAPLRVSAAIELVHAVYPRAPAVVAEEIVAISSGLPFSLVFLAAEAARVGAHSRDETEPSVEAALDRRLVHCTADAREALRLAAFLEPPIELSTIARAMQCDLAAISSAVEQFMDLVTVEDLRLSFRHRAIVDAVRAVTPNPVPYFTRLLRALDGCYPSLEILAARFHCAKGCGDYAVAASSALELGRALAKSSSLETSLHYLGSAIAHAPRPLPTVYALEYGGVLQQLSRDVEALSFLRAEVDGAIDAGDARSATDLLASFFSAALTLERFTELETLCVRVERMASLDAIGAQRLRSVRLAALAFWGRLEEFHSVAESGLDWVDRRPASLVAALEGNPQGATSAFELYHGSLTPNEQRQEPTDRVLLAVVGLLDVGTSALDSLESGLDDTTAVRAYPSGTALQILRRISEGRWNDVRASIATVPLWDHRYEEPYPILDMRLMFDAVCQREPVERRRTLDSLRTMIGRRQSRHAASPARWYLVSIGSLDRAGIGDITAFVEATLDVAPMPYNVGTLPLALALLAPLLSPSRCAHALDSWPKYQSRWHRAHMDLAQGLLERDHDRLRHARNAFDALRAPAFAMMAGLALPLPRARDIAMRDALTRHTSKRVSVRLTPREQDAAELAASGLPNREIAHRLGISERTVEVHLSNAFRKLGIRSRTGLSNVLLSPRR